MYVSLTAFALARREETAAVFTLVCDARRWLHGSREYGIGIVVKCGLDHLEAYATLTRGIVGAAALGQRLFWCCVGRGRWCALTTITVLWRNGIGLCWFIVFSVEAARKVVWE